MKQFQVQDLGYRIYPENSGQKAYVWVVSKGKQIIKRGANKFTLNSIQDYHIAMSLKNKVIDWVLERENKLKENIDL